MADGATPAIRECFAPGEVLNPRGTSLFGLFCSEPTIVRHYLVETFGSLLPLPGLPAEPDWWDGAAIFQELVAALKDLRDATSDLDVRRLASIVSGYEDAIPKRNYARLLAARHGLQEDAIYAIKSLPWPDISTFMGFRVVGLPLRSRHEFYEIKPDSQSGIEKGEEKIAELV